MGVDQSHIDAFKKVYACVYAIFLKNSTGPPLVQISMYRKGLFGRRKKTSGQGGGG